ncbi:MAG: aminoglycoside 6'-N-acetyltransferase [Gemmatimonadaceae bacterium]
MPFPIMTLSAEDDPEWLRMRLLLWPEYSVAEHRRGMADWRAQPVGVVLVADRVQGVGLAGFAEVGTRPYADGCDSSPVAYLEGWYVDEDSRRRGVGRALVDAATAWARGQGLREFASDALLENQLSHRAHEAVGFTEVERLVIFRRPL